MQAQVEIAFDQLVKLAKELPAKQWSKLKEEVEKEQKHTEKHNKEEHIAFLLKAPTFSEKQINEIKKTRKKISEWRKD
jgi:hypothetical protein